VEEGTVRASEPVEEPHPDSIAQVPGSGSEAAGRHHVVTNES
jgi:hypothetical protein